MSNLLVALTRLYRLAQFASALLVLVSVNLAQAQTGASEGKIGWYYYTSQLSNPAGYADNLGEACLENAANHFGNPLLAIRPGTTEYPHYDCYYRGALKNQYGWYGVTDLFCKPGYIPSWPDLCLKWQEVPRPATCSKSKAGATAANPVVIASGSKLQAETDFNGSAAGLLKIVRTYRSMRELGIGQSAGYGWSFSFDRVFRVSSGAKGQPPSAEYGLSETNSKRCTA